MLDTQTSSQDFDFQQLEFKLDNSYAPRVVATFTVDEIYDRVSEWWFSNLNEDRRVERKSASVQQRQLAEYFSMWGNTPGGGLIFIGVEDDGRITGCMGHHGKHVNSLEACARELCPDAHLDSKKVNVKNSDGLADYVIVFRVYYREERVVKTHAKEAFRRSGDQKQKLTEDEIREMQISKKEMPFELEPLTTVNFPSDFDEDLIDEFVEHVHQLKDLRMEHTVEDILVQQHLGIIRQGAFIPNIACYLLFAKDPSAHFPGCRIRFMRFEGETEKTGENYNLIKDVVIDGCIPRLINKAEQVIAGQLREFSALGKDGRFYVAPEYPRFAWYEAIVNACGHRSYHLRSMVIFVKMFDDKLVIMSPGEFPPTVNPRNIYSMHNPRNFFLMEALRFFGTVKCANEGTKRMRAEMLENKLPVPIFSENKDGNVNVTVTLKNDCKQRRMFIESSAAMKVISEIVFRTLSEDDKRLANYVAEHGSINVSQATRLLDCHWATAKRRLSILATKHVFKYHHRKDIVRDPDAHYTLNAPKK